MRWAAALASVAALACLEAPPGVVPPDAASPPVLFAAYRFEEPEPLADSSGNGRDALCDGIECPAWVLGRNDVGQAAFFDGLIDLVTIEPAADDDLEIWDGALPEAAIEEAAQR